MNMGKNTLIITEIEKNDLSQRRYLIGYTYFFMASTQLFSLILSGNLLISKQILIYILIATLGYFIAQIISKKIDIKKNKADSYDWLSNEIFTNNKKN